MNEDEDIRSRITPRNNSRLSARPQVDVPYTRERVIRPSGRDLTPTDPQPAQPIVSTQPVIPTQPIQPQTVAQTIQSPTTPINPPGPVPTPDQITSPIFSTTVPPVQQAAPAVESAQNPVQAQTPVQAPAQPYSNLPLSTEAIPKEKSPLPKGIYVLSGFILLGFIASFFNTSQTSKIYMIAMLVHLLLAVGLIMRQNLARIVMIVLSGLLAMMAVITIFSLVGLQHSLKQDKIDYETAVSHIDQKYLTQKDRQSLNNLQIEISKKQKYVGKEPAVSYSIQVFSFIEGVIVVIYLTRPKVKGAFVAH